MEKSYGIPVAARIPFDLAEDIKIEAKDLGVTMSKCVAMRLANSTMAVAERNKLLQENRRIVSLFIKEISKRQGDVKKNISIYNQIYESEKGRKTA